MKARWACGKGHSMAWSNLQDNGIKSLTPSLWKMGLKDVSMIIVYTEEKLRMVLSSICFSM